MRVIAGQYRRRTLRSLPGLEIRPTADRLRETLFNVLCAGDPAALAESSWLDLYAGTGAVGIEALSRGARMVYFVESSKAAAELIAANLKSLGIEDGFQIVKVEAGKALRQLEAAERVADFVFLDPAGCPSAWLSVRKRVRRGSPFEKTRGKNPRTSKSRDDSGSAAWRVRPLACRD